MPTTRAQQAMQRAWTDITDAQSLDQAEQNKYGGLCHQFPMLVRTCGLCQTLAFLESKSTELNKAHGRMLKHIQGVLHAQGLAAANQPARDAVLRMDIAQYVMATRQLLHQWIYYKRFAVSALKVKNSESLRDDEGG